MIDNRESKNDFIYTYRMVNVMQTFQSILRSQNAQLHILESKDYILWIQI